MMEDYFKRQAELEAELVFRNPWVPLCYNWVIGILIVTLFASFVWWGKSIAAERHDEAVRQSVYAEMDAEHEAMMAAAEEEQRQKEAEEAALRIEEAKAIARAWFGIRNFTAKYGYTNLDLYTYAMCAVVRAEAEGKTIMDVLAEKDQFIAYSDKNNLETDLYELATRFVEDYHAGRLQIPGSQFRYAPLTAYGIWLVDDPGKTVPERWHA